jgi:hypothetical protein
MLKIVASAFQLEKPKNTDGVHSTAKAVWTCSDKSEATCSGKPKATNVRPHRALSTYPAKFGYVNATYLA